MKQQNEIWKDIKGYEGLYQISNLGNVKSLDRIIEQWNGFNKSKRVYKGKMLKQKIKRNYYQVGLSKGGNNKWFIVHRLVAEAFIPNPNNLPCINHKNENKLNNYVDNLEWCTQSYNINYGTRNDKVREKLKGKVRPQEWCNNISKAKKGMIMSYEYKEKQKEICSKRLRNALGQFVRSDK